MENLDRGRRAAAQGADEQVGAWEVKGPRSGCALKVTQSFRLAAQVLGDPFFFAVF